MRPRGEVGGEQMVTEGVRLPELTEPLEPDSPLLGERPPLLDRLSCLLSWCTERRLAEEPLW